MTGDSTQVVVVPCSGIGKTYGTVSREAAYDLCDELRPDGTELVALAKLVLGEEQARERVRTCPAVTIDGCKLMCASKLVTLSGGTVAHEVDVLDVYRRHKELKPEGIDYGSSGLTFVQSGLFRTLAFIAGCVMSGLTGFIGMSLAVRGNVRTAAAARTSSSRTSTRPRWRTRSGAASRRTSCRSGRRTARESRSSRTATATRRSTS